MRNSGPSFAVELEHLGLGVEEIARPVDFATHERFRSALHRADDPAVFASAHRIDAEHHAAELGVDERLHEYRDRFVGCTGAGA